ncbi:hypothetical protein [Methylobacterium sp. CM6247]
MLQNFVTWWSSMFGLNEPTQAANVYAVVVAGLLFLIAKLILELIGDVLGGLAAGIISKVRK